MRTTSLAWRGVVSTSLTTARRPRPACADLATMRPLRRTVAVTRAAFVARTRTIVLCRPRATCTESRRARARGFTGAASAGAFAPNSIAPMSGGPTVRA